MRKAIEGHGQLLHQGRLLAQVDYHLAIPTQTYFLLNPTGKFRDEDYAGGFILLHPRDADRLEPGEYTLELTSKSRKKIRVARRYKKIKHQAEWRVSFWVELLD